MTAAEARRITEKNYPSYDEVYEAIENAAENAECSVRFDLDGKLQQFAKDLRNQLLEKGYDVKHEVGSDQRENEDWNYLLISW